MPRMHSLTIFVILCAVLSIGASSCKTRQFEPDGSTTEGLIQFKNPYPLAAEAVERFIVNVSGKSGRAAFEAGIDAVENEAAAKNGHSMAAMWQAVVIALKKSPEALKNFPLLVGFKPESRIAVAAYMERITARSAEALNKAAKTLGAVRTSMYRGFLDGHMKTMSVRLFGRATEGGVADNVAAAMTSKIAVRSEAMLNASVYSDVSSIAAGKVDDVGARLSVKEAAGEFADSQRLAASVKREVLGDTDSSDLSGLTTGDMSELRDATAKAAVTAEEKAMTSESMINAIAKSEEKVVKGQVAKVPNVFKTLMKKASDARKLLPCLCYETAKRYLVGVVVVGAAGTAIYDQIIEQAKADVKAGRNFRLTAQLKGESAYFKNEVEQSVTMWVKAGVAAENPKYDNLKDGAKAEEMLMADLRTQLRL